MPRPSPPHGRRSALLRRADGNVAAVSHGQHVPTPPLQPPDAPTRRWTKRPGDLGLLPFDLESGVRVTCDVGYLCANFGLPRPLCLGSRWLRPDVRDKQTDVRQHDRLMPRLLGVGHNNYRTMSRVVLFTALQFHQFMSIGQFILMIFSSSFFFSGFCFSVHIEQVVFTWLLRPALCTAEFD